MILKDEEDCIARCLNSVKDVVDEIVIVDTGCTDRTIDICRDFHAHIYSFPWNDNFSEARNYGIEQATGEWILWLDADEEVDPQDRLKLREFQQFENADVLSIHLINYYGDTVHKDRASVIAHTRLFRRDSGIRFINKIHECLDTSRLDEDRIGLLDVKLHHYGYMDPVIEKKGKFERNLRMLKQQIDEGQNVYWVHYYIASEYYRTRQWNQAFEQVNLSIRKFLEEGILPPSMVYKLKYQTLISMGSIEGAWPAIDKAIALYPDYVDLHFFKGIILYYLKKYDSAIETFDRCMEMGEDNIHHLILRGVGSFQAMHYKGLCLLELKRLKEAEEAFNQALAISPQYQPAADSLAELGRKFP